MFWCTETVAGYGSTPARAATAHVAREGVVDGLDVGVGRVAVHVDLGREAGLTVARRFRAARAADNDAFL